MMNGLDVAELRARTTALVQELVAPDQIVVTVAAVLLSVVFLLAVATIWRGRRRTVTPLPSPSNVSGFTRWLTPMGMKSIPAEQAVVARPRRKSGGNKTIRVSTPVSKVPTRALRAASANPLDIARKTGLARDAVAMMMASANPAAAPKKQSATKAAAAQAPTRSVSSERAMSAPGAYGHSAPRSQPSASNGRTLGTQFNARLG